MEVFEKLRAKARTARKTIVLPEGYDQRVIKAAEIIGKEQIADVILLGEETKVQAIARECQADLAQVKIVNPGNSPDLAAYVGELYEMRKSKGLSLEDARKLMLNPLYFGTMMVYKGICDGMVAGAANTTGDVLRPALQIIRTAPGLSVVSGCFLMVVPDCEYGYNGVFVFADSGVNPNPTPEQLAQIAYSSAHTARVLANIKEPKVAFLSFSTKGSAKHELVDKMVRATEITRERYPDLDVDGELQADAALVSHVAETKVLGSKVAGKANVLIFPDLNAGNIAYKLVERLAKATAVGPILQGIAKPVNDLSRGCSVDDVVNATAITAVQAQGLGK